MIRFKHRGDLKKTEQFLRHAEKGDYYKNLSALAQKGVDALASATPKDTGATASQWAYKIEKTNSSCKITWVNNNINKGVSIALILQYGHGTGTGGYVEGRDYINPAIKPVFDQIAEDVWKEVTSG